MPPGLDLICYADDTLVLARGRNEEEALIRAGAGMRLVTDIGSTGWA